MRRRMALKRLQVHCCCMAGPALHSLHLSPFRLDQCWSVIYHSRTRYIPDLGPTRRPRTGCYSDSWTRTLANSVSVSGPFSRESCIAACDSAGYPYAGVENGNECYCSNTVASTGLKTSDADCLTPCAGAHILSCQSARRWRLIPCLFA